MAVRVCAVIPTFFPDRRLAQSVATLKPRVDDIFVIDNHSQGRETLWAELEASGVHIHREEHNRGIAAALNRGARLAIAAGHDWMLTLDQDAACSSDLVPRLFAGLESFPEPARVAILGPRTLHPERSDLGSRRAPPYRIVKQLLTSGSLVRLSALERAGFFDESYFMDRVDFEICARLRSMDQLLLEIPGAVQYHAPGHTRHRRVLGIPVRVQSQDYKRRYFMARNTIRLVQRYSSRDPAWVSRRIGVLAAQLVLILLFEEDRGRQLRASAAGLVDGLRGRCGPRFADMRSEPPGA